MSKKEYPKGVYFSLPSEKAPDFVIGSISIHASNFVEWLDKHQEYISDRGYIKLDALKSKKGSGYCVVNDYKPKPKKEEHKEDDVPF